MRAEVSTQTLLLGSLFALQQSGYLLEDSATLLESSRFATAIGLALLAREERGRHRILLDFWRTGQPAKAQQVKDACDDHPTKQASGGRSLFYREHELRTFEHALRAHPPGSDEYRKAEAALRQIDKKRRQRQPDERHQERMRAFYVDLSHSGTWQRPSDLSPRACLEAVIHAATDYSHAVDRIESAEAYADSTLAEAIAALLFLELNDTGAGLALAFFGFATVLRGVLMFRSTFFPRGRGALGILAGLFWTTFLYRPLASQMFAVTARVGLIASLALSGWLLIKGLDGASWREMARQGRA